MKKYILIVGLIIGATFTVMAQVNSAKYLIEYNYTTNLYDCKVVIVEGYATTYWRRIQFNSQYSILVPKGSQVSVEELHNPLEDNQFLEGTKPCRWQIGVNPISPLPQSEYDFYTIFPYTTPTCSYNQLIEGDTVILFSLSIDADPCEGEVRLFENGIDIDSTFMNVGDYDNSFKIANLIERYDGNLSTPYDERYFFEEDSLLICKNHCTTLDPIYLCSPDILKFEWSTGETTDEILVCPESPSNYYVLVKDSTDNLLDSLTVFVGHYKTEIEKLEICINETTIATSNISGGTWGVDFSTIANIDTHTGVITGLAAGETKIRYKTPSGCAVHSDILNVYPNPEITIEGEDKICLGETVSLVSNSSGTWINSDSTVVSVTSDGQVEGIGVGSAAITFIDHVTGCTSDSVEIQVFETASAALIGPNVICPWETSQLSYISGGNWSISYSSNPIVATHDNFGLVTAFTEGKIVFRYTNYYGVCDTVYSDTLYVKPAPPVSFIEEDRICVGGTSSVFPNTEGTWVSSDPSIAVIDATTGIITGNAQGAVRFSFTDSITGCSATTSVMIVDPVPTVFAYYDTICINTTVTAIPSSGGVWNSLNPEIATVDDNIITGISYGDAAVTFTSNATGCASFPLNINVGSNQSTYFLGKDNICIGDKTIILPASGGIWTSSDKNIATIDNHGIITGISAGEATFSYIGEDSLCITNPSDPVYVKEAPTVSASASTLCISETMNLEPGNAGTWTSANPEVASVSLHTGTVTAQAEGSTTFTYTSSTSGCSATTDLITVLPIPFVINGAVETCPGEITDLALNIAGTWLSEDPNIATVNTLNGAITAVSSGSTIVTFTEAGTGCTVDVEVVVHEEPSLYLWGNNVCVGENAQVAASAIGTWISNDPSVATVDITGKVTAVAPGQTTFTFTFAENDGCSSTTEDFVVLPWSDPQCIVGLEELDENLISIYPNPARDIIFVDSKMLIESISIYTMEFQKVEEISFTNVVDKSQISIENLSQGLHFIAIKSKDKTIYKKIIVE